MSTTLIGDITAGIVAIVLVVGIVLTIVLGRAIPGELWVLASTAFGWLFRASMNGGKNGLPWITKTPPTGGPP